VAKEPNVPARRKNNSRPDTRRALGARGEVLTAERYLAAGYEILDRNWRCRQGELDLVVHRDRVLVFCEVKTRSSDRFGAPIEAITREKRQRIRVLAGRWLDEHKPVVREVRFDVASVLLGADGDAVIDLMEAAF
jgi:putative endonuclease